METCEDPREVVAPQCPICCSSFQASNVLTLSCGHPFCTQCILKWWRRSRQCPVCRETDDTDLVGAAKRLQAQKKEQLLDQLVTCGEDVMALMTRVLEGINKQNGSSKHEADRLVIQQLLVLLGTLETDSPPNASPSSASSSSQSADESGSGSSSTSGTTSASSESQAGSSGTSSSEDRDLLYGAEPFAGPRSDTLMADRHPPSTSEAALNCCCATNIQALLTSVTADVENLVHDRVERYNAIPDGTLDDKTAELLGEKVEELFIDSSVLEAVKQSPDEGAFAIVEDLLARVTILDEELDHHLGPISYTPRHRSSRTRTESADLMDNATALIALSHTLSAPSDSCASQLGPRDRFQSLPALRSSAQEDIIIVDAADNSNSGNLEFALSAGQRSILEASQALLRTAANSSSLPASRRRFSVTDLPSMEDSPSSGHRHRQSASVSSANEAVSIMVAEREDASCKVDAILGAFLSEPKEHQEQVTRALAPAIAKQQRPKKAREADQVLDGVEGLLVKHRASLGPRARQIAELAIVLSRLAVMADTPDR